MARGTKPLPRNLRVIYGTQDRKDRGGPAVPIPEPPVTAPPPPAALAPDEAEVFTQRAQLLAKMRVMTASDVDALAIYAKTWCDAEKFRAKAKTTGGEVIVAPKTGTPMYNPFYLLARGCERDCMRILAEFGLTPSSRNRVSQ